MNCIIADNLSNCHGVVTAESADRCAHMSSIFNSYWKNVLGTALPPPEKTPHNYREDILVFLKDLEKEELFEFHPNR